MYTVHVAMHGGDALVTDAPRSSSAHESPSRCTSVPVRTVHGLSATLRTVAHDPDTCREFVLATPAMDARLWLACAAGLYALGYALHLHSEVCRTFFQSLSNALYGSASQLAARGALMAPGPLKMVRESLISNDQWPV